MNQQQRPPKTCRWQNREPGGKSRPRKDIGEAVTRTQCQERPEVAQVVDLKREARQEDKCQDERSKRGQQRNEDGGEHRFALVPAQRGYKYAGGERKENR